MLLFATFVLSVASAETQNTQAPSVDVNPATLQSSAQIQLEWGENLLQQGHYVAALAELQDLVAHHDEPVAHWTLARIHHAMGNTEGELAALQVFFTVAPPASVPDLRDRILELGGTLPMRTLRGVQRTRVAVGPTDATGAPLPFWK